MVKNTLAEIAEKQLVIRMLAIEGFYNIHIIGALLAGVSDSLAGMILFNLYVPRANKKDATLEVPDLEYKPFSSLDKCVEGMYNELGQHFLDHLFLDHSLIGVSIWHFKENTDPGRSIAEGNPRILQILSSILNEVLHLRDKSRERGDKETEEVQNTLARRLNGHLDRMNKLSKQCGLHIPF